MSAHQEFVTKNKSYIETFDQGHLAASPSKAYVVVTCMDARVESASQLGIGLGEAHVIRNAGGSAVDALRSIIISQRLLGTREIAIVRHTNCGMLTFTTDQLRKTVKDADPKNATVAKAVDNIDFLEFSNLEESVKQDVNYLRENPLVLTGTVVTGWVYDVRTGGVSQVV